MVRVMGHMRTSGSASRSASGASGRSSRALAERRVCTPELALSDVGCETADVLRRFEGAIERTVGVAASPALGTLRISSLVESDMTLVGSEVFKGADI